MRSMRLLFLAAALAVGTVLVAPAPARAQGVELKPTKKIKHDKYLITAEEIAERPDLKDGYDVVKQLRSQWLRTTRSSGMALSGGRTDPQDRTVANGCRKTDPGCTTGPSSGGSASPVPTESGSPYAESGSSANSPGRAAPVIYIDEIKREGLDELRTLRPVQIAEIRFMTGTEASGRYGAGHEAGAILVKTVRAGGG